MCFVQVQAADQGTPALSSTCVVHVTFNDINDNAPVFKATNFSVIVEEEKTSGQSVATMVATDLDSGVNAVFSFTLGPGNAGEFAIDPSSGAITTAKVLDRESSPPSRSAPKTNLTQFIVTAFHSQSNLVCTNTCDLLQPMCTAHICDLLQPMLTFIFYYN